MGDCYVGAISGTSVDGLDLALVRMDGDAPTILTGSVRTFPPQLAETLRSLAVPGDNEAFRSAAADAALGEFIGHAVLDFLGEAGMARGEIRAVGSHGQTIRHHPDSAPGFTVQIGDPNRIAEVTGIDTVADFRRRDMAAGGEGAPLAPLFHDTLFRHPRRYRTVLNIGGIANVTHLPPSRDDMLGYDTGPGNALLDAWCLRRRDEPFDADGAWAASGTTRPTLLDALMSDAYLARPPPKSTGKEVYNLDFIRRARDDAGADDLPDADIQATLAEFTAASVTGAIERWGENTDDIIVCGGGRRNGDLMARLAAHNPGRKVVTSEAAGVDGDLLEAGAFAWLAHRTVRGLPGNVPAVTGARGERVLGAVYPGAAKEPG